MTFEQTEAERVERHPTSRIRLLLGLILAALVLAVGLDNRGNTRVGYVLGDVRAPMVVVLCVAALAGAVIGWLLLHRPHHPHH